MKTPQNFSLNGVHVLLRPLTVDNATAAYAGWLNDPEVNRYLETRTVTVEELQNYIRDKNAQADALFLGVFWKEGDVHVGNVKLEPIDWEKGTAVFGILIGEKAYWGKGVATEATKLITDHALRDLGLKEVSLGVISENKPAIRVYEKCGFTIDRIEKDAVNHDGTLFDRTVMRKTSSALQHA